MCRKFLWAYSFWRQWCLSRREYASRYGRDQHVGCVTYESRGSRRIHTTHVWNLLQVEWSKFQPNISISGLGTKLYRLWLWKTLLKGSIVFKSKLKLRRFLSGTNILGSRNIYTTYNQQFHWDVLRHWWLNLSLSLSLFIPIFCVLPVSLRDCLYREKDVDGGLCDSHIAHLVHPKKHSLDSLQHAKKGPKNLANIFFDAIAILQKQFPADGGNFFS